MKRQCSTPCWRRKTSIGCIERDARKFMRWEKNWYEMKNKFFHPPARTSFLSMLLLFPYFLCCPPSPPCRAALHAGACWPWRPTRYCQPIFHIPFCGLQIFLRKDALCMSTHLPSSLPPFHIISLFLILLIILEIIKITIPKLPFQYLGLDNLIGCNLSFFGLLLFQAWKRWSIYLVWITFIVCK